MYTRNLFTADCRVDLVNGALAITSPYDANFVAALKATIPGSDRKWDPDSKRWMVSTAFGSQVKQLIQQHYGIAVSLPERTGEPTASELRLLDVRYLGAAKGRDDGSETAFAWANGGWNVIFPKKVLLEYFGQTARPDESPTLYGVLGVSQSADPAELKAAWKRLARTWHPDISKEPGSAEQFRAIQEAYEVLGNPTMRAKYNAGLVFEALAAAHSKKGENQVSSRVEWRAPLRCGLILVEGNARLGRFIVTKIVQWADLTDGRGNVLVTSWALGNDTFTEAWIPA